MSDTKIPEYAERGYPNKKLVDYAARLLRFIGRFWTEADKRVGENIKYWR